MGAGLRARLAYVFWGDVAILVRVWPGPWTPERQALIGRVILRMEAAERSWKWTDSQSTGR